MCLLKSRCNSEQFHVGHLGLGGRIGYGGSCPADPATILPLHPEMPPPHPPAAPLPSSATLTSNGGYPSGCSIRRPALASLQVLPNNDAKIPHPSTGTAALVQWMSRIVLSVCSPKLRRLCNSLWGWFARSMLLYAFLSPSLPKMMSRYWHQIISIIQGYLLTSELRMLPN